MILADLKDTTYSDRLSPEIARALKWINEHRHDPFMTGSILLDDNGDIRVNREEVNLRNADDALLEAHRRYLDIHVPLSGPETIGWSVTSGLSLVEQPYDKERDVAFFSDKPQCYVTVTPGQYIILFPEDAHAPMVGEGAIRKVIVKVRL